MNKEYSIFIAMHKLWTSIFGYDPKKYWLTRGESMYNENIYTKEKYRQQEKKLLDYLSTLDFSSVLEVGCGFGRITRLLLDNFKIKEYLAIDISPHLVNQAMDITNQFNNVEFKIMDITELHPDKKYDLVIGVEVLMHVKPSNIYSVVEKLIQIANKHVINVDWFEEPKPKIRAGYNFVHDYHQIYKKNPHVKNVNQIHINIKPPSTIFHAQIN